MDLKGVCPFIVFVHACYSNVKFKFNIVFTLLYRFIKKKNITVPSDLFISFAQLVFTPI